MTGIGGGGGLHALDKNSANKIRFRTSPVRHDRNQVRQKFALQKKNKAAKARIGTSPVAVWLNSGMAEVFPGEESWEPGGTSRRRNAAWHWCDGMGWLRRGFLPGSDWIYITGGIYLAKTTGDASMGRRPCRHSLCVLPTQYNGFPGGKIHEKFGKSDKTSS